FPVRARSVVRSEASVPRRRAVRTVPSVTDGPTADEGTAAALVETLRRATGRAHLDYVAQPTPLTGGFDAEMLRFRLADPPAELDGELVARLVRSPEVGAWEATMQREVA